MPIIRKALRSSLHRGSKGTSRAASGSRLVGKPPLRFAPKTTTRRPTTLPAWPAAARAGVSTSQRRWRGRGRGGAGWGGAGAGRARHGAGVGGAGPFSPKHLGLRRGLRELPLLTPWVHPVPLYRCGKGTCKRAACWPPRKEKGPDNGSKHKISAQAAERGAATVASAEGAEGAESDGGATCTEEEAEEGCAAPTSLLACSVEGASLCSVVYSQNSAGTVHSQWEESRETERERERHTDRPTDRPTDTQEKFLLLRSVKVFFLLL